MVHRADSRRGHPLQRRLASLFTPPTSRPPVSRPGCPLPDLVGSGAQRIRMHEDRASRLPAYGSPGLPRVGGACVGWFGRVSDVRTQSTRFRSPSAHSPSADPVSTKGMSVPGSPAYRPPMCATRPSGLPRPRRVRAVSFPARLREVLRRQRRGTFVSIVPRQQVHSHRST